MCLLWIRPADAKNILILLRLIALISIIRLADVRLKCSPNTLNFFLERLRFFVIAVLSMFSKLRKILIDRLVL